MPRGSPPDTQPSGVTFDHIGMTFPDGTRALDDVSFGVAPG